MNPSFFDHLFFALLPYVSLSTFFLVTIQRYRAQTFTYSSLSSQFLENKRHFWSLVPFHYGILAVLAGHIIAFLCPRTILAWNSVPLRLYILEISALIFGLFTLFGIVNIVVRRATFEKVREVTSTSDWILYGMLLLQVISGVCVAIFHPWGSSWFAATMTPYLWSVAFLNPDIAGLIGLPFLVKFHIALAWLVIGFFPFTRLVHILVIPNPYLWRKPQVVRWNWNRLTIRNFR